MRAVAGLLAGAVLCCAGNVAAAQVFTVDANDPGADFQSLYDAVITVPGGSVLRVLSNMDDSQCCGAGAAEYHINKDLTIIGDLLGAGGRPVLQAGIFSVTPLGGPDILFNLRNVEATGASDYHLVQVGQGATAVLESCLFGDGGSEHDTLNLDGGFAVVNDCVLRAKGLVDPVRASAVRIFSGAVVLKDTTLTMTQDPDFALDVNAGVAYTAGLTIQGNVDVNSPGQWIQLDQTSIQCTPLSVGGSLMVSGTLSSPTTKGLLFLGLGIQAPANSLVPFFLVPGTFLKLTLVTGSYSLTGNLPNNPILTGVPIHFQHLDAVAGWSILESRIVDE